MTAAEDLPGPAGWESPSPPASTSRRGDIPAVPGPAEDPQIGSYWFSKTRKRDDGMLEVGGVVIDTSPDAETGEAMVRVVGIYRGRIRYDRLPADDIVPSSVGNFLQPRTLRQLLLALAKDEIRNNAPLRHDFARRAIAHALEGAGW